MAQAADQRRLATIIAIDVVGYSGAAERDQAAAAKLVAAVRSRIGELASAHRGRIFSTAGDGFMLEFPLASAGVTAAVELLKETAHVESGLPSVRAGGHIGEVLVDGDDLLGHTVNVAARLSMHAAPNGLVISEALKSQIHGETDVGFAPWGPIQLSKMRETISAYGYVASPAAYAELRRKVALLARRHWRVLTAATAVLAIGASGLIWLEARRTTYDLEPMQLIAQSFRPEFLPALSPDGSYIAYTVADASYTNADLVMRAIDGGEETLLAGAADMHEYSPAFSPTGDRLAYALAVSNALQRGTEFNPCQLIVRVLPNGIDRRVGVCEGRSGGHSIGLSWTPDGKGLVYCDLARVDRDQRRPSRIRLLDLDTGQARDLVAPVQGDVGDFSPSISPDGRRLAFVRYRSASDGDVIVLDLRSRRLTRVVEGVTWAQVSWADAHNLLATLVLGNAPSGTGAELWLVPANGSARQRLLPSLSRIRDPDATHGLLALTVETGATNLMTYQHGRVTPITNGNQQDRAADFSHEGTLAFVSAQSSDWLYIQRPGEPPRRLVRLPDMDAYRLHWSPDGRRLAYSAKRGARYELFVIDAASGVIEPLHAVRDADLAAPAWSPDGRSIVFSSIDGRGTRLMRLTLATGVARPVSDYGWVEGLETDDGLFAIGISRRGVWRLVEGQAPEAILPDVTLVVDNAGTIPYRDWTVSNGRAYAVDHSVAGRVRILSRAISGGPVMRVVDVEGAFDRSLAVNPRTGAVVFGALVNRQADIGVIRFRDR